MELTLTVNGRPSRLDAVPGTSLLRVLRESLLLTGTKEGCVEGECGACTVLIDGRPVDSCLYAAHAAAGKEITTIEGIAGDGELSSLQQAIVASGGVQCGFCTPGVVMTLVALLNEAPNPTESQVRDALAGNICRCTGYSQIVDAVMETAGGER
jgi:aerobic carbon-monoxide dehydrogenase small subunit